MNSAQIVNRLLEDEDDFDMVDELDSLPNAIPHPDNPLHVDNLRSLRLLRLQDFKGTDASLEESLFEYGLAWRELPDEWLFVHALPGQSQRFERATVRKDVDMLREYSWVDWHNFLDNQGENLEPGQDVDEAAWFNNPLPWKIADLINYYGVEEVLGTPYSNGFRIDRSDSDDEVPFTVTVYDANGLWGELSVYAPGVEVALERAAAEIREMAENRETEIDLESMWFEV